MKNEIYLIKEGKVNKQVKNLLKSIRTPKKTNTWKPLNMYDVIDKIIFDINLQTIQTVQNVKIHINFVTIGKPIIQKRIKETVHSMSMGIEVGNVPIHYTDTIKSIFAEIKLTTDSNMASKTIFVLNSINKSVALKIGLGYEMSICSNGMILGSILELRKRHTGNIEEEFNKMRDKIIDFVNDTEDGLIDFINELSCKILTREEQNNFLGNMLDVFPIGVISKVYKYRDSKDNLFPIADTLNKEASAWYLYNWFTEAFKTVHNKNRLKYYELLNKHINNING